MVNENVARLTTEGNFATGIQKPKAVLRMTDLCTLSGSFLHMSAIAATSVDLCCNISSFFPFLSVINMKIIDYPC